ncbi:MAG: sulfide/dihydroorotate dehydrogenase-like FAD/NAD-binding protein [Actinomycetota bacterium]|nr:sulfide/dihydroorotate dehydrogenase-like FAD/NAD-binding protein [Actinomycetota bacterium]
MENKKFEIVEKEKLAEDVFRVKIRAEKIAKNARAGQFFILRVDEKGERIPLTFLDFSPNGTIEAAFQVVGTTTTKVSRLVPGDEISDAVGPLGNPTDIESLPDKVFCVGGGVGIAAIYPIAREILRSGRDATILLGARDKEHLILLERINRLHAPTEIVTDDGSSGVKGFVTDILLSAIQKDEPEKVIAVGPVPMMKAVSKLTEEFGIPTVVSLNPIMLDGTGMCGTCRVEVGGETKFACVDGPEFDGHLVNWKLLQARLDAYKKEEGISLELFKREECSKGGSKPGA